MSKLTLSLSWPEPSLWPNEGAHWQRVSRARRGQRADARMETLAALNTLPYQWDGQPVNVRITGHKPAERGQDRPNFQSALKAAIDGIADAIGVNDKHFVVTTDWGDPAPPKGGVTVEVGQ